jgi:hypothetical protein
MRRSAIAALWLSALFGCAETQALASQVEALRSISQRARERGAYQCAPEELATSQAQLEFAAEELAQGDLSRARDHLVLARANASAAARLSAGGSCGAGDLPAAAASERAVPRTSEEERTTSALPATENSAQRSLRRRSSRENAAI